MEVSSAWQTAPLQVSFGRRDRFRGGGKSREGWFSSSMAESLVPHFLPSLIADRQAYREHGIDVFSGPMHPRSFEMCLDHQFVRTFDHPRSNGPALCSKLRIL